jgi:hypothetical protein
LLAFRRRAGLSEEAAVHGEVFAAEQRLDQRMRQNRVQEALGDVALEQPIAAFGIGGRMPHGLVDPQPDEPPEEQIEVETLHHLTRGTHSR